MALLLADISLVVTQAMTWAGSVVTFIVANPLVLIMFAIPLVGIGIGLIKRLV